jgi:hypothetical protein
MAYSPKILYDFICTKENSEVWGSTIQILFGDRPPGFSPPPKENEGTSVWGLMPSREDNITVVAVPP